MTALWDSPPPQSDLPPAAAVGVGNLVIPAAETYCFILLLKKENKLYLREGKQKWTSTMFDT